MRNLNSRDWQRVFAVTLVFTCGAINCAEAKNPLTIESRATKSGEKYSFVLINNAPVRLVETQPDSADTKLLMSLPIAFTSLNKKIIGAFVHDGTVDGSVSKKLSGTIKVQNNRFEIVDTNGGALLSKSYLDDLASNGGALVQQFLIVRNGKPSAFKDKGVAQRRAVGTFKGGKEFIVESKGTITLAKFANDLVALGAQDCVYSDLGAWGQSWVRDPGTGKLIKLANENSVTENHTNWLLVSEAPD
ncbi:MAG: hypothetical protein SGJ27_01030 [Candidatus Melainabacteria bacterium]|nr:hypothetical protein [Candidatus Melainabacteria bacterium]